MKKYADTGKIEKIRDLRHLQKIAAARYADRKCYTYRRNGKIQSITFGEHKNMTDALGSAFFALGLMGKRVALISESRFEWTVTYLAAANGGGCIVPIDKEIKPEEIINFIERSESSAAVYSGEVSSTIEEYAKRPDCKVKYFINMDLPAGNNNNKSNIYSFESLIESGEKKLAEGCNDFTEAVIDPDKMCVILFTSGTTGTSKAVMLSHKNMAASIYDSACGVDFDGNDRLVSVLPVHHTYEATCGTFATYSLGCEVFINDSLKTVLRNFNAYKPTALVLVPLFVDTMLKKIWDEIEKRGKTKLVRGAMIISGALRRAGIDMRRVFFKEILDSFGGELRLIVCGGAPLNPAHIPVFDAFGITLVQGYGTTECAPLLTVVPSQYVMKKIGSAGPAVLGVELKIDSPDGDKYGEILAKGDNVMLGYMDDEEATGEVMTDDGFYRTGDIGCLDGDGFLYITGRKKNVIISSGGKNIYPEEIEEYLNQSELIGECAVIARTKKSGAGVGGLTLCALIYPNYDCAGFKNPDSGGLSMPKEEINKIINKEIAEINKKLPLYKQINIVEIRESEFEKTASRKIMRDKLS
ncbi:MAG: AMP-binding protein [Oscillospiraceae bacterium]|nr:AMP-binding protein [Oscillospiraceae bacterium]